MNTETDYLNFLKTFVHEDLYLFDDVSPAGQVKKPYAEVAEEVVSKVEEPAPEFSFHWNSEGKEDAPVAFIINENTVGVLPEIIRERFVNMLKNLKLDPDNIFLANISGKSGTIVENKIAKVQSSKIVLLGMKGVFPHLASNQLQPVPYEGKRLLFAPSFSEIIKDKQQVVAFWNAMKDFL